MGKQPGFNYVGKIEHEAVVQPLVSDQVLEKESGGDELGEEIGPLNGFWGGRGKASQGNSTRIKKTKDLNLINMILFLTEYHFFNLQENDSVNLEKIIKNKAFVISNINKFVSYNLNQTSLLNSINMKLSNG